MLLNPLAATGAEGEFEMGDWRGFLSAGEDYTAFAWTGERCRRLRRGDRPVEFRIGLDAEVIDLGELSLAP